MGLFDFIGEALIAPVKIAKTVVVTTAKTTVKTVTGDLEGAGETIAEGVDEVGETIDEVGESLDKD